MKKVLVTFPDDQAADLAVAEALRGVAECLRIPKAGDPSRSDALKGADAVITFITQKEMDQEELALLKEGCLLQSMQAGVDALPFDDIPERVIICANTGAWADPMGEHILGMILSLGKHLQKCHDRLSKGIFDRGIINTWFRGKTCGFVGFGGIAKAVARLVRPIGMKVIAVNTSGSTDEEVEFIGTLQDLPRVLEGSDVLVIAVPLTRKTRGLIGQKELALMKDDAILINPARGAIIDQKALYERMKAFPEFRVGIDAWWEEPLVQGEFRLDHPFFELDNLLGSPHNTNLVAGMFHVAAGIAAKNVRIFLEGGEPKSVVDRKDYQF